VKIGLMPAFTPRPATEPCLLLAEWEPEKN